MTSPKLVRLGLALDAATCDAALTTAQVDHVSPARDG